MTTAVSRPGKPRMPDREDEDNRYYDGVAFASSDYVPWIFGELRLGKADLSRLRDTGCPVLRNHQPDNLVGAVSRAEKKAGLWRSDWRLPKIAANANTFDQMDSGILRGISVGGRLLLDTLVVDNEKEADTLDDMRFTCDWVLIEESLTSIPADTRAGIDRMLAEALQRDGGAIFDTLITEAGIFTTETPALRRRVESLRDQHNQQIAVRREEGMTTAPTITDDAIERAIASHLEKSESLKRLAGIPDQLDKLTTDAEAEAQRNMEYRAKLDTLQLQPGGSVLQMENWGVRDTPLSLGKILRLTCADDIGLPPLERSETTLEESFLERLALEPAGRSVVARLPFDAITERERQIELQRNTMAGGAGARRLNIHILGDGGLLLNAFNPILGAMNMRSGLSGGQKQPYWTAQGSAAGGAEGSDIPISTWTLDNEELLPVSIATGFDISSSLRAADDMTFESLVYSSVQMVAGDELVKNVLIGGGSAENEIAGLWGRVSTSTPDQAVAYGAAQTDFSRDDILSLMNLVDLAKTDGGPGVFVLSTTLYQLAQNTLRGGAASDRYLLETMDGMNMGVLENRPAYHYRDLTVASITDPGLYFKADRSTVFLWGNSFTLEEVPVMARKTQWKLCVEANLGVIQPNHNLARIAQG